FEGPRAVEPVALRARVPRRPRLAVVPVDRQNLVDEADAAADHDPSPELEVGDLVQPLVEEPDVPERASRDEDGGGLADPVRLEARVEELAEEPPPVVHPLEAAEVLVRPREELPPLRIGRARDVDLPRREDESHALALA